MHKLVIAGRQWVRRLAADKAHGGAECRGDVPGEDVQVEGDVSVGALLDGLDEVGREGGGAHGIAAAAQHVHVLKVLGALLDGVAPQTVGKAAGGIVEHRYYVQVVDLRGGLLHEVAVAEGEGVGVHDDDAVAALAALFVQVAQVGVDAVAVGFQEHGLWGAAHFAEG